MRLLLTILALAIPLGFVWWALHYGALKHERKSRQCDTDTTPKP